MKILHLFVFISFIFTLYFSTYLNTIAWNLGPAAINVKIILTLIYSTRVAIIKYLQQDVATHILNTDSCYKMVAKSK